MDKKVHAFLNNYDFMKQSGKSQKEIAVRLGFGTDIARLRSYVFLARAEKREDNIKETHKLRSKGLTNVAIAKELGVSESTVRNYLREELVSLEMEFTNLTSEQSEKLANAIREITVKYGVEAQVEIRKGSNG